MNIKDFVQNHQQPNFRIKQFNQAYYQQLIASYDELTTWSKDLREQLKQDLPFTSLEPIKKLVSANQDTTKLAFRSLSLPEKKSFEAVLMQHGDGRNTVCVSSMIGCPLGCKFCATGKLGFIKNLTTAEIVDQVLYFARILKQQQQAITNVVFMGMGEPLLNLGNVWSAIQILNDSEKFALGKRRVTISTAGLVQPFRQLVKLGFRGRVAVSLHAPNQQLREQLMPVARQYPLTELLVALDDFVKLTNKRVTYEYILIRDVNDQVEHALQLTKLLKNRLAHVNLIPYNPVAGEVFIRTAKEQVFKFAKILEQAGIEHSIRVTMGDDIKAACGQLAGSIEE